MTESRHRRTLVVWDVPDAIETGAVFRIKVGLKCESACPPLEWSFDVRDHDDALLKTSAVRDDPAAGTEALYHTEIELRAPADQGLFGWSVWAPEIVQPSCEDSDEAVEHAAASARFNVRAVPGADHRLTVIVTDKASQKRVAGAKVVVHPYRARTDEHGVAKLDLPSGPYRLFVSGKHFFPYRADGELASDTIVHAELELDLGPSDAEVWS